jgi:hypothetical protein
MKRYSRTVALVRVAVRLFGAHAYLQLAALPSKCSVSCNAMFECSLCL